MTPAGRSARAHHGGSGAIAGLLGWLRSHRATAIVAGIAVLLVAYSVLRPASPVYEYTLAAVSRGPVESGISASGKVRALNTIKVGSEVSGQVVKVLVDYNSRVARGQVLAVIDPTRFRARVDQTEAQVAAARATLAQARAALAKARVDVDVQRRELSRRRSLQGRGFVSNANLDAAEAGYAAARAAFLDAEARGQSARAMIAQGSAERSAARLDLRRTLIVAPAAGVVINKLVEPGATVAASFQTPNLFEIASDLTRMQVEASIDEADIGRVRNGQPVRFTVDSYPDRTFAARVRQIRQSATEAQNVVSYLVVLDVDNLDGALLPGMTANVTIVTGRRGNAVRVPTAALLFSPAADDAEPEGEGAAEPAVWVAGADPYEPRRREVRPGLEGEDFVEILAGVKPGERVLVGRKPLRRKPAGAAERGAAP